MSRLTGNHQLSAEKWRSLIDVMAPEARLNDTEKANVLANVKANAKQ